MPREPEIRPVTEQHGETGKKERARAVKEIIEEFYDEDCQMRNRPRQHELNFGRTVERGKRDDHVSKADGDKEDKQQHRHKPVK